MQRCYRTYLGWSEDEVEKFYEAFREYLEWLEEFNRKNAEDVYKFES